MNDIERRMNLIVHVSLQSEKKNFIFPKVSLGNSIRFKNS